MKITCDHDRISTIHRRTPEGKNVSSRYAVACRNRFGTVADGMHDNHRSRGSDPREHNGQRQPRAGATGSAWPQPSDTPLLQGQALQAAVQRIAAVAAPAGMRGVTAAVLAPEGSWAGAVGVNGSIRPSWDSGSTSAAVTVLVTPGRAPGPPVHVRLPAAGPRVGPNQTSEPTVRQLLSHTSSIPHYARRSG